MIDPETVLQALRSVQISNICDEPEIHRKIKAVLAAAGIPYRHEYKLISHKRFDFWINGIVIEVKKVKPPKAVLLRLRHFICRKSDCCVKALNPLL